MSEFKIRPNESSDSDEVVSHFFCVKGKHEYIDEDGRPRRTGDGPDTLAKAVFGEATQSFQFYIKSGRLSKLLDPFGLDLRHNAGGGRIPARYRKVNKQVFDLYLNFLKTRNKAYLLNAERAL